MVAYTQTKRSLRSAAGRSRQFNAEAVKEAFHALFEAVATASPPPGTQCRLCSEGHTSGPRLVNGTVDRVCDGCVAKMQSALLEARAAYDAIPTNLPLALVAGIGLAALGAIVWAGVGIATGAMWWLVAIGMGLVIGAGVAKAAGKGGLVVQGMCIVFTLLSVAVGELMFTAYYLNKEAKLEGASIDWAKFIAAGPEILFEGGGDTVFALGGGLIGAIYAARFASRPKIELKVE